MTAGLHRTTFVQLLLVAILSLFVVSNFADAQELKLPGNTDRVPGPDFYCPRAVARFPFFSPDRWDDECSSALEPRTVELSPDHTLRTTTPVNLKSTDGVNLVIDGAHELIVRGRVAQSARTEIRCESEAFPCELSSVSLELSATFTDVHDRGWVGKYFESKQKTDGTFALAVSVNGLSFAPEDGVKIYRHDGTVVTTNDRTRAWSRVSKYQRFVEQDSQLTASGMMNFSAGPNSKFPEVSVGDILKFRFESIDSKSGRVSSEQVWLDIPNLGKFKGRGTIDVRGNRIRFSGGASNDAGHRVTSLEFEPDSAKVVGLQGSKGYYAKTIWNDVFFDDTHFSARAARTAKLHGVAIDQGETVRYKKTSNGSSLVVSGAKSRLVRGRWKTRSQKVSVNDAVVAKGRLRFRASAQRTRDFIFTGTHFEFDRDQILTLNNTKFPVQEVIANTEEVKFVLDDGEVMVDLDAWITGRFLRLEGRRWLNPSGPRWTASEFVDGQRLWTDVSFGSDHKYALFSGTASNDFRFRGVQLKTGDSVRVTERADRSRMLVFRNNKWTRAIIEHNDSVVLDATPTNAKNRSFHVSFDGAVRLGVSVEQDSYGVVRSEGAELVFPSNGSGAIMTGTNQRELEPRFWILVTRDFEVRLVAKVEGQERFQVWSF